MAMQPIFGIYEESAAATDFLPGSSIFGQGLEGISTNIGMGCNVPRGGTLSNFRVKPRTALSAGSTTWTIVKNGVDTAIQIVINVASGSSWVGDADSVSFAAGDRFLLRRVETSSPTATTYDFSGLWEADDDDTAFYGYGGGFDSTNAAPEYINAFGGDSAWGATTQRDIIAVAGNVTGLSLFQRFAVPASRSRIATIMLNGVAQDGSGGTVDTRVTVAAGQQMAYATFTLPVALGDRLSVRLSATGTLYSEQCCGILTIQSSTPGRFNLPGFAGAGLSTTVTSYNHPGGNGASWVTTADTRQNFAPSDPFSVNGLEWVTATAPGTGDTYTLALRNNSSVTSIAAVMSGTSNRGSYSGGDVDIEDGDLLEMQVVPTGSPATAGAAWWSFNAAFFNENDPPVVDAGDDQAVNIEDGATLVGSATDDGLPDPPAALTYLWIKVSGPGTVTFADDTDPTTHADFSAAGVYVLRLTADDSEETDSDDITITVDSNEAPVANAGPDQTLSAGDFITTLAGSYTDDTYPGRPVSHTWSTLSGPFAGLGANFSDPSSLTSDVTFPYHGVWVLQLSVTDTEFIHTDTVQITISGPAPVTNYRYRVEIDNVDYTHRLKRETVDIEYPEGNQGSLSCVILDEDDPVTAYRPPLKGFIEIWLEILVGGVVATTVKVFTGRIVAVDEAPIADIDEGTGSRVTANDYQRALASRLFTGEYGQFRRVDVTPLVPAKSTMRFTVANTDMIFEVTGGAGSGETGVYTVELQDPGAINIPLALAEPSPGEHVVTLQTDGAGVIITTAAQIKALIDANGLIEVTHDPPSTGVGVVTAKEKVLLTGYEPTVHTLVEELLVTSAPFGNPAQTITYGDHGLSTGDTVKFVDVQGSIPDVNDQPFQITVTAVSAFTIPLNVTTAGTGGKVLKLTPLDEIIDDLAAELTGYSINLVPLAVPSPWIEPKKWRGEYIEKIVKELMAEANWTSRITPDLDWEVFETGTVVSATTLRADNTNILGEVSLLRSDEDYINRIYVYYGPSERRIIIDGFIADGVVDEWTLRADLIILTYGHLFIDDIGGGFPMGIFGVDTALEWTYDPTTKKVHHNDADFGVVAAGTLIRVPYTGEGQLYVTVPSTPPVGEIYEDKIERPDLLTEAAATLAGQIELDRRSASPRTLNLQTLAAFELPGTAFPIDLPRRLASGEWPIVNTRIGEFGDTGRGLFTYETIETGKIENYVDYWKKTIGKRLT